MKNYNKSAILKLIILIGLFGVCIEGMKGQGLVNNGSKVLIQSGAYLIVDGNDGNIKTQTESSSNGTFSLLGELKLSGDFTNNNSVTGDVFTVNSGDITFNGSTIQEVNGTAATNFGDMVLANSVEFNSVSQQAVSNIDLSGGKLLVGDVDFTVNPTATITNYSTTNYIVADGVGKLSRTINDGETVFFPVGSSTKYAPVTITQAAGADDGNFKVRVVDNVLLYATSGSTIEDTKKYVNKTWFIESTASNLDLEIELNWTADDHMNGFDPTNCYISHYNSADSVWDFSDQWGSPATENDGLYSIKRVGVTSLSPFTVGDESSGTLPVELVSFEAKTKGDDALLTWLTASEHNNKGFEILSSLDGSNFKSFGFVAGSGNSNIIQSYNFVDENPILNSSGGVYYQLRQFDFDGNSEKSKIIYVDFSSKTADEVVIFPNPTNGLITIMGSDDYDSYEIYNNQGKLVKEGKFEESMSLDLSCFPKGIYNMVLMSCGAKSSKRIMVF